MQRHFVAGEDKFFIDSVYDFEEYYSNIRQAIKIDLAKMICFETIAKSLLVIDSFWQARHTGNACHINRIRAFYEADNLKKEGNMEKKYLKKVLTGLSVASLVAGMTGAAMAASG
ncbi:MAG: hypothetical protein AMK70_07735 [Nitrospira bacterium SG8_35_1]|nr:MAG: hypothetical protein AMK70_07735 [Nitrospira bacterium SG8_35_1]